MNPFMRNITKDIHGITGLCGHVFGGPYHWTHINNSHYYNTVLKYVYRNPVRARLCQKVENYRFSTYSGLVGNSPLPFPISYTRAGMERRLPSIEPHKWMEWLNRPFASETENHIRFALKKTVFKPPLNLNTRKIAELDDKF